MKRYNSALLPDLLKHMTLAVFNKNKGKEATRFLDALDCARNRLVQLGYATKHSLLNPIDKHFKLTTAGIDQNKKHKKEARSKSREFDALFDEYSGMMETDEESS